LGPEPDGPAETGSWRVADRVALAPMLVDRTGMGVLRQFGVYDRSALLPVPANYSDRQGAAYWNAILSIAGAMDMAGLGPGTSRGRTIAFTAAAGGIATVGLQLARAWGAETLATTRRQEKATRLSPLATHVAVVRQPRELVAALRGTRFERGIDVIIDPIRPLRHAGLFDRLVEIGMAYADQVAPVLAGDFSFDEAPRAIQALARSEHVGKITVTV
jgi:NADPH2:quinone reductase